MKHDKIFDGLIELESQVKNLQKFISRMEDDEPIEGSDKDVTEKWGQMSFDKFLSGGANEMITSIFNDVGNTNKRLRHIVEDESSESPEKN